MKHTRTIATVLTFMLLCVSLAYWGMQWFLPSQRLQTTSPRPARPVANTAAAAGLFGGQALAVAASSNFKLTGVVKAWGDNDSVAIIAVNGKSARAYGLGAEVVPGVSIKAVHATHILLSENGTTQRIDLSKMPQGGKASITLSDTEVPAGTTPPALPATAILKSLK